MRNTIRFANWLNKLSNWDQILTVSVATMLFVAVVVYFLGIKKRRISSWSKQSKFLIRKVRNEKDRHHLNQQHMWHYHDLFIRPIFCNVCEQVVVSNGIDCSFCNVYIHESCLKKAERQLKCKTICQLKIENSGSSGEQQKQQRNDEQQQKQPLVESGGCHWSHHWVKGNLPLDSVCYLCSKSACCEPALIDYKCVWCWRYVHGECLNSISNEFLVGECNFGNLVDLMLKPSCLIQTKYTNFGEDIQIKDVKLTENAYKSEANDSALTKWTPLFVFLNEKSGNNDAEQIYTQLTAILNPLQIIEMNKIDPILVLEWMAAYSHRIQFKILVCGGDGSIGWVLDSMNKLQKDFKKYEPAVGILPLGTGNDLSRALGWGDGYLGDVQITEILEQIRRSEHVKFDRWKITIDKLTPPRPEKSSITTRMKLRSSSSSTSSDEKAAASNINNQSDAAVSSSHLDLKYMNNYLSIGCDALVTLNFHLQRKNAFFANRLINKFIYFKYGTIDTFMKECSTLSENIEVELDGKLIENLPHLESIVILNIPYWGGGVQPWTIGDCSKYAVQSYNDKTLEVFGIYSSFHIAKLQVSLAEPYRIGQASSVKIKLKKKFPLQIDGEPWLQAPSVITISHSHQCSMLSSRVVSENNHHNHLNNNDDVDSDEENSTDSSLDELDEIIHETE